MIINHNIAALNTHRQMGSAQSAQMDSMEKLSSGMRINKAADDAAGLSISEKMRGQIRGLEQASTNAQDSISLIQTAEGALSETQDILQRMREISVQSSNGTYTADDRKALNDEFGKLKEEIDSISDKTTFNTQKLLNGNFGAKVDSDVTETTALAVTGVTSIQTSGGIAAGEYDITVAAGVYTLADAAGNEIAKGTDKAGEGFIEFKQIDAQGKSTGVTTLTVATDSDYVGASLGTTKVEITGAQAQFQIGANKGETLSLSINDMSTTGLALNTSHVGTFEDAQAALESIDTALKTVSSERSNLGATQNRLDHTINNLNTSAENITAAESRIRDVDYAEAA
ncbi:flagellin [Planococcus maritimus]|uniref:flagellin N-terminal helical domain-containing protein n=1 Tax=Planococcus maritimus TaxID=192421 RepID=UPI00080F33C1|nr:flagellin [Planococcus maritimus]ANU15897.1 flagellin [Planococcus maritimus]